MLIPKKSWPTKELDLKYISPPILFNSTKILKLINFDPQILTPKTFGPSKVLTPQTFYPPKYLNPKNWYPSKI